MFRCYKIHWGQYFLTDSIMNQKTVSSRGLREQSGGWGGKGKIGVVWNLGTTFSQLAIKRMLTSGIFKQLGTFVVVS